jgi:hypothetical protein
VYAGEPSLVAVQGEGSVSAAPDVAYVNIGVVAQGDDAAAALAGNSAKMKELVAVGSKVGKLISLAKTPIHRSQDTHIPLEAPLLIWQKMLPFLVAS